MKTELDVISTLISVALVSYSLKFLVNDFSEYWLPPKLKLKNSAIVRSNLQWIWFYLGIITSLATIVWFLLEIRRRRYSDMVNAILEVGDTTNELYDRVAEEKPSIKECFELLDASAEVYEDLMLLQEDMGTPPDYDLSSDFSHK